MLEYKVEEIASSLPAAELQERLNEFAKEDWQLAQIASRPDTTRMTYIFRREAKEKHKPVTGFAEAQLNKSPKTENV